MSIPPPIRSALVSAAFTANTALGFCVLAFFSSGRPYTVGEFFAWLGANWFVLAAGYFYGVGPASTHAAMRTLNAPPPKGNTPP